MLDDCLKCRRGICNQDPFGEKRINEPWCRECRVKYRGSGEYAQIYAEWFNRNAGTLLREMGVPWLYQECTLDGFVAAEKDQRRVLRAVRSWFDSDFLGLFLCGPYGTGKTHLAVSALLTLRKHRNHGQFVSVQELLMECRDSFRGGNGLSSVLKKYSDCDALLLDDLGAENSTDFARETLGTLIDRAYRTGQLLVVTSNFDLGELAGKLDARIADRLVEICLPIKFTGSSYRHKMAAKKALAQNLNTTQVLQ